MDVLVKHISLPSGTLATAVGGSPEGTFRDFACAAKSREDQINDPRVAIGAEPDAHSLSDPRHRPLVLIVWNIEGNSVGLGEEWRVID
ncbi:hypothetical protein Pmi06nite_20080 [Planotetraspora mira]|uniref:Uncharacterized protein n=1 Tax=Planotetraspora mira TaxID=58121 RepID=A0A8J3X5V6_9ACTN|nr:hypothetical protein Pmi06nite_20080 [Planotetraspora mira]